MKGLARLRLTQATMVMVACFLISGGKDQFQQTASQAFRWPRLTGVTSSTHRLTLLRAPVLEIGAASGPDHTLFSGIVGAVRLESGGLAIADAGNYRVLFFDRAGALAQSVGRKGKGPGEFQEPRWFDRCADGTTAVYDGAHQRLISFSPSGRFLGSVPLPLEANFDPVVWCSGRGHAFMLYNQYRGLIAPGAHFRAATALVRTTGATSDTIAAIGGDDYYSAKNGASFAAIPLGNSTLASANGAVVFLCSNMDARCQAFDTAGVRRKTFVLPMPRHRVSSTHWKIAKAEAVEGEPLLRTRRMISSTLEELPAPTDFPLLDQIRADADGRLWVRTFDNYDTSVATWVVVNIEGSPVALVATPRALHVLEIGRNYLIGFTRDSDGVERVQLHLFSAFTR